MDKAEGATKSATLDRRAKILALLESEGKVEIRELNKLFNVSEVSIRNDLAQLEKKNLLVRARGGAMKFQRVGVDYTVNFKAGLHSAEKQAIGKKAAELINEGETIILDSGTTTLEIAKRLSVFNDLTVITNSLNIAGQLVDSPNVKVIIPGGSLRRNSLSLIGSMAEDNIKKHFCDKSFIAVDGIDTQYGISTPNVEEAHLNNIMIDISREVFVVTDSSKFKRKSFAYIAPITKINTVITDRNIPLDEKQNLLNSGIKVIIV